jgi:hypothetical protein
LGKKRAATLNHNGDAGKGDDDVDSNDVGDGVETGINDAVISDGDVGVDDGFDAGLTDADADGIDICAISDSGDACRGDDGVDSNDVAFILEP